MAGSQEQGEIVIVTEKQPDTAERPDEVAQVDEPGGSNIVDGVVHYCLIDGDGYESCGGCARDWPCPDAQRLTVQTVEPAPGPAEVVAQSVATGLPWPLVADQLGVDRPEVQAFIDAGQ